MYRAAVIGIVATMTALALTGCNGSKDSRQRACHQQLHRHRPVRLQALGPRSSTTTMPPVMSASSVTQFVTAFYNEYAACHGGRGGPTCTSDVVNEVRHGEPRLLLHTRSRLRI